MKTQNTFLTANAILNFKALENINTGKYKAIITAWEITTEVLNETTGDLLKPAQLTIDLKVKVSNPEENEDGKAQYRYTTIKVPSSYIGTLIQDISAQIGAELTAEQMLNSKMPFNLYIKRDYEKAYDGFINKDSQYIYGTNAIWN